MKVREGKALAVNDRESITLDPVFKEDFAQWLSRAVEHYAADKQYEADGPFFKLLSVSAEGDKVFVDVNGLMIRLSADLEAVSEELRRAIRIAQKPTAHRSKRSKAQRRKRASRKAAKRGAGAK
jgi:hypothetical protein